MMVCFLDVPSRKEFRGHSDQSLAGLKPLMYFHISSNNEYGNSTTATQTEFSGSTMGMDHETIRSSLINLVLKRDRNDHSRRFCN
ncbi:hypothetical protein E2C01_058129 [Portunus trituberculatus]|uniref:Uncharacterized protein n=1 Tax=Portunus trituberculatus TaxID=210409 RepID=A0A5B7H259_PORTR|nr:hypothetical protein [Portunus trituberculatus]